MHVYSLSEVLDNLRGRKGVTVLSVLLSWYFPGLDEMKKGDPQASAEKRELAFEGVVWEE